MSHPPDVHWLQEVEEQKYSSIIFDNKLQWGSHLNYACKMVSYYLYLLMVQLTAKFTTAVVFSHRTQKFFKKPHNFLLST